MAETPAESWNPGDSSFVCLLEINTQNEFGGAIPCTIHICFWNYKVWGENMGAEDWKPRWPGEIKFEAGRNRTRRNPCTRRRP